MIKNAAKCSNSMEVTVQTRLLFNVYFGLMSFDDVKARPWLHKP